MHCAPCAVPDPSSKFQNSLDVRIFDVRIMIEMDSSEKIVSDFRDSNEFFENCCQIVSVGRRPTWNRSTGGRFCSHRSATERSVAGYNCVCRRRGQCAAFRPGQPYCPRIDYARSEYKADRANDLVRSPLPRHHSLARTSARPRVFRSFPHTRNGGSGIDEWMGANSTVDRSGSRILPVLLPDDNPLLQATHSDSNPSERPSTSTDIPLQQAFRLAIRSDKHSIPTVPTGHPLRQAFQI